MKHYDLLILSKNQISNNLLKEINHLNLNSLSEKIFLNRYKDFTFDYLLTDDLNFIKDFDLMMNDNKVITNCFFETSIENIFAIGNCVSSKKTYDEQLNTVLCYILNPF